MSDLEFPLLENNTDLFKSAYYFGIFQNCIFFYPVWFRIYGFELLRFTGHEDRIVSISSVKPFKASFGLGEEVCGLQHVDQTAAAPCLPLLAASPSPLQASRGGVLHAGLWAPCCVHRLRSTPRCRRGRTAPPRTSLP